MMEYIRVQQDDTVLRITLDRPQKLNAFFGTMREDLLTVLNKAEHDPSVRALLITGAGRGFCGGGDVTNMSKLHAEGDVPSFSRILDAANATTAKLHRYPKPTIAAVNGPAAGGGANLALACDFRIGSDTAAFTQSFIKIGLGPDWGGSYVLPRIVGEDRAKELLLSGRTVQADEALTIGLLHELVNAEELLNAAQAKAEQLGAFSPLAIKEVKEAVHAAPTSGLESVLERERSVQIRCFLSEEAGAAFKAFAQRKRSKKGS